LRGIRPYYNKFRAYVVDSNGIHHQEYFETEQLAEEFILKHRPTKIGNAKYKKRSNARSDLPVGLCETMRKKKLLHGVSKTPTIVATVVINGKAKTKTSIFGKRRSREDAIKICLKWRNEMLSKTIK